MKGDKPPLSHTPSLNDSQEHSAVDIMTKLRAGRSGGRFRSGSGDCRLFPNFQAVYGAHPGLV